MSDELGDEGAKHDEDEERMDQPAIPPPGATEQSPSSVYVAQMLRQLETELRNLQQKVDGIPGAIAESRRADLAELETRLTKAMGDGDWRVIIWLIGIALTVAGLVIGALRLFPPAP